MTVGRMTSRDAVLTALTEYDRLGQDGFLEQHGYGKRTRYALVHQGRRYDPKAILGVAHGIEFPDEGPLPFTSFHGAQTNGNCDSWASRLCWSNR